MHSAATEIDGKAQIPQGPDLVLQETSSRPRLLLVCVLLVFSTLLLYQSALWNAFVNYDDPAYVTANSHVLRGLSWANISWALRATVEANWHPVTWISHMADVQVSGLNPIGHHLTNVLLHVCNVLLLFLLLYKATGYVFRSAVVAALFALHPLNVESVAWVAERKSLLSTLFLLLSCLAYVGYVRSGRLAKYGMVAFFFGLGLMAKPAIVTFPFVLLLLDYWPFRRFASIDAAQDKQTQPQISFSKVLLEKLPLLAMSAASAFVTIYAQRVGGAVGSTMLLPFNWRIKNAVYSYLAYLVKGLWPSRLAVFYPHPENSLQWWSVAFAGLLLVGMTFLVWHYRKKQYLLTGWLWYLGTMVPMIGLVQVGRQGMADRYAYIPFIGLFVLAVWLTADLVTRLNLSRSIIAALALAVLFGYASVSYRQISYWRNSYTLFSHAI